MVFLVIAAIAMAWIKMDFAHCNEDGTGCKVWKHQNMKGLFKIGAANMVQGDVRLMASTTEVDIANIEAGFGAVDPVSIAEAEAAAARQFQSGGKAPMYRPP